MILYFFLYEKRLGLKLPAKIKVDLHKYNIVDCFSVTKLL